MSIYKCEGYFCEDISVVYCIDCELGYCTTCYEKFHKGNLRFHEKVDEGTNNRHTVKLTKLQFIKKYKRRIVDRLIRLV